MRILIAGCGYVGIRLAGQLVRAGHQVIALRRHPPSSDDGFTWMRGDLIRPESISLPEEVDTLVLAAGLKRDATEKYEELFLHGYPGLINRIKAQPALRRIIMVSTTGVFAEQHGDWVDEQSPTGSSSTSSHYYAQAEKLVQASGVEAIVARLSGIYGPDRIRLIREVAEGRAVCYPQPPHYLNHLHADDAAGALAHLVQLEHPANLYIVSDNEPADRNDVLHWLANRLQQPDPAMAGSTSERPARRSGNKRCSNQRLRAAGYHFHYPTYREGYESLLRANVF